MPIIPMLSLSVSLLCGWPTAASAQAANNKKTVEPWQRKPYSARDEADEDNFRQSFLKMLNSLVQASYRRYLAEGSIKPEIAASDPNEPVSTREALRGSTLLELHEQGAIWLSLLLSSHDPSVQQFQSIVLDGLEDDPSLSAKQVRKKVRKYDITKQAQSKQATDLIIETENEFGTLVKNLSTVIPKTTDSRDYYERLLERYGGYLKGQMPRLLDLSRAGEPTTFFVLSPRFGNATPLEKDIRYKRTQDEAKKKTVTARDVRYQGVYVVRVTPLDRRGESFHLACFWLYLRINDPEMYVSRDPAKALTGSGGWDLHHMPPTEFSNRAIVSPPLEWMQVHVRNGKLVIVKGQSTFLQRRAIDVDLEQTPIDRVQPAPGDIDPTPPRFSLSAKDYARLNNDFSTASSRAGNAQPPKPFVDIMPTVPARYQFPDTPEGEQAYQKALADATSPYPNSASALDPSVSSDNIARTTAPSNQPSIEQTELAKMNPTSTGHAPFNPPVQIPAPDEVPDPSQMHLDFGKLPIPAETRLNTSYTQPTPIQQQRLKLALYWIVQFLSDAKAGNTQSDAMRLLLSRLPSKIYCVSSQSIHTAFPITGTVVIAGMRNSFDAPLPDLAMELLGGMESMVYQFGNGQPNSEKYRFEIRQTAERFFSSQPLDATNPEPFLSAVRVAPTAPDQWRLLSSASIWDCPNPYRFFETKKNVDDENDDPPAKLEPDTIARLKLEKAAVTELGLDGIFNKDIQGAYRNDQGALLPIGLLFQLIMKEPAGLMLLRRAEENERILSVNAAKGGNTGIAAVQLGKANEIAGMLETVKRLREEVPNAYLDLYLIKTPSVKRISSGRTSAQPNPAPDALGSVWRARWIRYKDRYTLVAGVRQSDIPPTGVILERLADALNEKLPAGMSVLPALRVLKESIQNSSDPQYGTYAAMLANMDRIEPVSAPESTGTTKP